MPERIQRPLQITIFLDFGSRPRFSMILGTFCKYFERCFAHCVRPPTCSFDASGQRFSFILAPFPAYFPYVLYMFRKVFCVPCAISFDLLQNRLDLDLVLRRSIGEACSIRRSTYWMLYAVIRQEYLTPSLTLMDSKGPRLRRRPTPKGPKKNYFFPVFPFRTHLGRLYLAILAPRCPSRRQVEPKIRIQTPLEPILDPSCTQHRPT